MVDLVLVQFWCDYSKFLGSENSKFTILILHVQTNRFRQTVQTLIRLLPQEQSDQGLHWLLFPKHHMGVSHHERPS